MTEKRVQSRRQMNDDYRPPWGPGQYWRLFSALLVIAALLIWQWRFLKNAPVYLVRAYWADHSDIYMGRTNGIPNKKLIQQARDYVTDIDHLDASGNLTAPESLRPLGVHLDAVWFKRHAPESIDFDPFITSAGHFAVTWIYRPDCQKAIWKSSRSDTDWADLRGEPCFALCGVSVLMAPNLRLIAMPVRDLRRH